MTEIELKAHVDEPDRVERAIAAFAAFSGETVKRDTYYRLPRAGASPGGALPESTLPESTLPDGTFLAAVASAITFLAAIGAAACVIFGASKSTVIAICLFATAFVGATSLIGLRRGKAVTGASGGAGANGRAGANGSAGAGRGNPIKVRIREEAGATTVTYKRKEVRGSVEINDEKEFTIDDRAAFEAFVGDVGFESDSVKEKRTKGWVCKTDEGFDAKIELSLVGALGWFVEIEILLERPEAADTDRATGELRKLLAKCGVGEREIETRYYTEMLAALEPPLSQEPKK